MTPFIIFGSLVLGIGLILVGLFLLDEYNSFSGPATTVLGVAAVVFFFVYMFNYSNDRQEQCQKAGGVIVTSQCIDRNAVIPIGTDYR